MKNFCERLTQIIDYYANGRNTFFANIIGMRESNVRSWLSGTLPKIDAIEKIAINCENLSLEWFILGEGSMLRTDVPTTTAADTAETPSTDLITPLLDRIETQAKVIAHLEIELEQLRKCQNET